MNKLTPEKKLISEVWEKQATYDDPRLSEMVDMYKEIGFDVHLEPFDATNEDCYKNSLPRNHISINFIKLI